MNERGGTIWTEPLYGYLHILEFANGKRYPFYGKNISLNAPGPIKVTKDKTYTSLVLEREGLPVAKGYAFYRDDLNLLLLEEGKRTAVDGWDWICSEGKLPMILKPNDLSQGMGITLVSDRAGYDRGVEIIWRHTDVARVEHYHEGHDHRVVVFDGVHHMTYGRSPLSVKGDGERTINTLYAEKRAEILASGRKFSLEAEDPRIISYLSLHGYTLESILEPDEEIDLLANANLSTGGSGQDLTELIHPDYIALALRAADILGLRLAGVDILTKDITAPMSDDAIIIEVNGSPGLAHYMTLSSEAEERTKTLYRRLLDEIEKK